MSDPAKLSPPAVTSPPPEDTESSLRTEVEHLGRIVDEQERTIASLRHEVFLHRTAIGWRLQLRLDPFRAWMLGIPVCRQIYRIGYRALELWVNEGIPRLARQFWHKLSLALRGRPFLVEDRDRVTWEPVEEQYAVWIKKHGTPPARGVMAAEIAGFRRTPLVSVLAVLDAADPDRLRRVLATLQAQVYERWELCLPLPAEVREALARDLEAATAAEPRLRVGTAQGAAARYADAFSLSSGEFLGILDEGDELASEALFELVKALQVEPIADIVYSDEDAISAGGRRDEPMFKPDWSPDLLLSTNYLAHFGLLSRPRVVSAGGFSAEAGLAEVYDLTLRLSEKTDRISHAPKVLYHRQHRPTTVDAILARHAANADESRALVAALGRRGLSGRAKPLFARGGLRSYETRLDLRIRPLVSIIIPTRNKRSLLQTTIDSIRARTDYDRYEIIVVDNGSTEADAVEYLASIGNMCRVLAWNETFNYSAINNFGATHAKGEYLLFLNNDMEVTQGDWLTAMLEHAQRHEVGAVGAKLLFGDGRIQHAGVVVGIGRSAANAFRFWPGDSYAAPRLADLTRNCSAVTGACLLVRKAIFDEIGGFNESLRVVLNDVDLCLRIRQKGYLVVYTASAVLYHHEGSSRGFLHPPPDQKRFEELWGDFLDRGDPYYNPNLSPTRDDWSLNIYDEDHE